MLEDKLGELNKAFSWTINRLPEGMFSVTVYAMPNEGPKLPHRFETEAHKNIHKAVEEAVVLYNKHVSDCPIC